ncbi:MAG: type II secretion system F family protein [Steroidobacteraceae bacterium]
MRFIAKTVKTDSSLTEQLIEAIDETDARRQLTADGSAIISMREERDYSIGAAFTARGTRVPLISFSQELIALLDAGLSLVEAIDTLAEKETNPAIERSLAAIRARLFEGRPLSLALEEQPRNFPPLYVATIRASERTGDIREALTRFIAYQQQIDVLKKKIISASIYPLVLCTAGLLVIVFLIGYVVPRFSAIYEDMGGNLPLASRLLMQWGRLVDGHAALIGLVAAAAIAAIGYLVTRSSVRAAVVNRIARIPSVGQHLQVYQLARLYRTVGMLLRGGMPAVTAITMSEGLLSAALRPALQSALQAVREGRSLAQAMQDHGLTTPVAVRMLRVGERTGNMGEMMERIAAFYDDQLARLVDILTRLIEPILMAFIGLIIGLVVMLMYFPIFELAGAIQ